MKSHVSKAVGSRVALAQVLYGFKAGQFWAIVRDPETQDVLEKYPMVSVAEGEAVELAIEFVAEDRER